MKAFAGLVCLLLIVSVSEQRSSAADDHYWAGVVEYSSKEKFITNDSPEVKTANALAGYKAVINKPEASNLDIIVFPEATLNVIETASFVPEPGDRIAPCNNQEYEPVVRDLSCEARAKQIYLVVNIVEKARCPANGDERPCAPNGLYHFNTNVIFDRDGIVIARYRKFNLFGEPEINTTVTADVIKFDTDFGITFGTFICFDLMFDEPALRLIREGVTDIIFPTMWFSELPFLTAVQIQQAWAYKNNVNLLAAGASFPEIGSTGTGIYAGRRGRIVSIMNHQADIHLYTAQVPKRDRPEAFVTPQGSNKFTPSQLTNLKLNRDQIDSFDTVELPLVTNASYTQTVCQNEFCCKFAIDYTMNMVLPNQQFYRYRVAVSDGNRTFDGSANGTITTCAVFACTGSDLVSCATRFSNPESVVEAIRFNSIELDGEFPGGDEVFLLPNSVDTSILPFEVQEIEYSERSFQRNGKPFKHINHKLIKPRSDLYTFAIWGRKFYHDTGVGMVPAVSKRGLRHQEL